MNQIYYNYERHSFITIARFENYHQSWEWYNSPNNFALRGLPYDATPERGNKDYGTYTLKESKLGSFPMAMPNAVDENYALEKGQDELDFYRPLFGKERSIFPHEVKGASFDRRRLGPNLLSFVSDEPYRKQLEKKKNNDKLRNWGLGHLIFNDKEKPVVNPENTNDFLRLSSVKELQITETLAYFQNRLPLFEKKELRTLFWL